MEMLVESDAGTRLDAWLASRLSDLSRSRIQELIREQHIRKNDQVAKPRDSVSLGDRIQIEIPEPIPAQAQAEDIPLKVLYEDDALIVIDKAEGMVVHPAAGNADGTLVNALLHHCKGQLSGIGGVERPGIVHRLDKDTSGCLIVAKTDATHRSLVEQFADRTTDKRYLAVVQGCPIESQGTVFTNIGRHPVNRLKMAVVNPGTGKPAITDYEVLVHDPTTKTSLILCHLKTGRTHQIRVHMLHLGCPLIGDPIYAKPARQSAATGRMMLHAWRLSITHPETGNRLSCEAPIPPEYTPWLQRLETPIS
ncbi:RluA family pseudouridine synthase [Haloferula sp.]|uniref:RluA family pseudouridine synthase n=1 Tax=Haloferula sp. TaxID=2497595 RepID=UPI003C756B0F